MINEMNKKINKMNKRMYYVNVFAFIWNIVAIIMLSISIMDDAQWWMIVLQVLNVIWTPILIQTMLKLNRVITWKKKTIIIKDNPL